MSSSSSPRSPHCAAMSLLLAFLAETTPLRARTLLVVNHVFPKELLKTRDVENLLRAKPAAEVPYTEVEMIRSVNEGVPLVIGAARLTRRRGHASVGAGRDRHRSADRDTPRRRSDGASSGGARAGTGGGTRTPTPCGRRV